MSNKNPENKRRDLTVLAALIEHPDMGLILFETGCAEDLDVVRRAGYHKCGDATNDVAEMGSATHRCVSTNDIQR